MVHHHLQDPEMDPTTTTTSLPAMNALEILRETVRILRSSPRPFLLSLFLLICPFSAALLSVEPLLLRRHVVLLSRRLLVFAASSGLPVRHVLLHQISRHLAGTLLSSLLCLPLLLSLLLPARSLVSLSVAFAYANGHSNHHPSLLPRLRKSFPRLVLTSSYSLLFLFSLLLLFLAALSLVCSAFSSLGYPSDLVLYPALLLLLVFSVAYAHAIIVCNLAAVMSVLEDGASGLRALLRSVRLVDGQTQAGLLIFLISTIGMAFVEGLFEHRVKTLSYGDGSSRIWEAPLLVVMYSFVVLVDFMMSAVFYFTCRSSEVSLGAGEEMESFSESVAHYAEKLSTSGDG